VQRRIEHFDQREVRAQPAAIEAAVAPGHGEKGGDHDDDGQEAAQDDGQRRFIGTDMARTERVDAQTPALSEKPQLRLAQVETQQVERRRQQEYCEEGDLEMEAAALHGSEESGVWATSLQVQR
jgi:hypothetical protein